MNTLKFGNGEWYGKEGTILAYNDENSNYKPLPFDFSRDSKATVVNKDGLIETVASGEPRIDYKDDSKGALLLEPSRTNLYTYSNDVSFWTKSNVVTTSDYAISPDGTQNAFRAAFSSSIGLLYVTATGTTGTNNTLSVWAKSNNGSSNKFRFFANGNTTLSNDFIATDEWQRFEFTFNCTSVTAGLTGASDSATNDIIFYAFQHEVGSYPTSYIPTQGSIVTRNQDVCNNGGVGVPIFSNTYAVWFMDLERIGVSDLDIGDSLTLRDDSNVRQITLWFDSPSKQIRFRDGKNSLTQIGGVMSTSEGTRKKIALKIDGETLKLLAEGSQVGANYTKVNSFDITQMTMQGIGYKIRNIKFYNTTLTDQELIALTS